MKKRMISMILSVVLLLTFLPLKGLALESDTLHEYAREMASQYLSMNNVNPNGMFYLSQGLEIVNAADGNARVYFLFEQETCIGKLEVTQVDGQFASSYVHYPYEAITELLEKDKDF